MAFALPMVQGNTKSPFEVTSALQRQKNTKKKKKEKPQSAAQKLFDPVEVAKQLGRNQETVLQTPEAKQRFKDSQDPFKNGFFKKPTDQSASKMFNREQAKNDVQVAQGEQTNAQKLFAPAVPDIQTDKAGNKLASRNGQPVGYSGNPKGAASVMRGNRGNPNSPLGMTNAESAQNQGIIQNVASQFEPYSLPQVVPPQTSQISQVTQAPSSIPPTPFAGSPQGLPNDTPNAASSNARALAFQNAQPLQSQQNVPLEAIQPQLPTTIDPLSVPGLIPKLQTGMVQNKNLMSDWWTRNIMGEPATAQKDYVNRILPIIQQKRAAVGMQ